MSKIKDKITRLFKQIFRKIKFPMIDTTSKQNYNKYHRTYDTLSEIFGKLENIDAYLIGGISVAIQTNQDLYRQNSDIDIMCSEEQLPSLIAYLQNSGYRVDDKRGIRTGNTVDINGQFHAIDHELNADTRRKKFLGVGIFTYSVKGNEVITHSYSYHEKEGRVIGIEKVMPKELFDLMYDSNVVDYKGIKLKTQSKEYIYLTKSKGTSENDQLDASVIEPTLDDESRKKIARIKELESKVKLYRLYFDKDGKIESREKTSSLGDKVNSYLDSLHAKSSTETLEQIINDVLQYDEILKYITPENLYRYNLTDETHISYLIKATKNAKMFLFDGEELTPYYQFTMANIIKGCNLCPQLNKEQIKTLCEFDDIEIMNMVFSLDATKQNDGIRILKKLCKSNSAELRRIKIEVVSQILEKTPEEYDELLKRIEDIYLTSNIPNFAKRFMVFRELHSNLLEKKSKRNNDDSIDNIPSLNGANGQERSHIIFSDLLRCALESNNRNLRDYLNTIERGNKLYEKIINEKERFENFSEADKVILTKYRNILNSLYNESSHGRRAKSKRKVEDDIETDLRELDVLFEQSNPYLKNTNLADRVVRTFGYWAGVNSLAQAKQIMEDAKNKAEERSKDIGKYVELKKGDFVKVIEYTRYSASMLQNGIVAKDFLVGNAKYDGTPLDTDVQKILEQKESFLETLNQLTIAKYFTNLSVDGKDLGTIMFVFDGKDFIETRDEHGKIIPEKFEELKKSKDKLEAFSKGGSEYGIRTGIGSTKIKYIIADRYVDKLCLEIVLNGFYIPIVDKTGKVIFTKEMYKEIEDKMQGLSYYDKKGFVLDETAINSGVKSISQLVEKNIEDAEFRRNKVLKTINNAIEKCGYKMSKERRLDLRPGLIEVIDIGSTGRGTNLPGDGDFDFMVRLDKFLADKPEKFKQALRSELERLGIREKVETRAGDFKYQGVKINGLNSEVDIDLSFSERTDEIEYSTDEALKDYLNTIKNQDIDTYKIIISNILLAKKMLKKAGAYRKKDAPAPRKEQPDTRGGLGAVGIENWILQNGGSMYKAAKTFLEVAQDSATLAEFQQRYTIWDFGENNLSTRKKIYPHDNFVYNLNERGFKIMKETLEKFVELVNKENASKMKKSLRDLVAEDTGIIADTPYMQAVYGILDKEKLLLVEGRMGK